MRKDRVIPKEFSMKSGAILGLRTPRVIIMLVFLMLAVCAATSAQPALAVGDEESDPLTVIRMFTDALCAKNLDAAMALLAEDVVFGDSLGQAQGGKAQIRGWLGQADYDCVELCDVWLSDGAVDWTVRVYKGDSLRIGIGSALVKSGKIKFLAHTSW